LKLIYSEEFNTAKKINGMQMSSAYIAPAKQAEVKSSRAIALYSLAEKGELSDTGIHELGHMQTADNIKNNIPDPLAIRYRPIVKEGKQIPLPSLPGSEDFYASFSQSDEVRQHAFNFWNATHQRVAREVLENFRIRKTIKAHELFGVNRTNFFESMDEALTRLQNIKTLNYRGEKLNTLALEKLESYDKLSYYTGFQSVFIDTPEGRVSIPLTPSVRKSLMKHTKFDGKIRVLNTVKFPITRAKILGHVKSMLENANEMYRRQKEALEAAEKIIADLKMNPDQELGQDQFLKLQDRLGRVKTSVNLKTAHLNPVALKTGARSRTEDAGPPARARAILPLIPSPPLPALPQIAP
ncbi:MAG: hypothetical protein H7333_11865, partial [Bdellovibrionales bacterium]|nr:hypothetical protein [Oligoflexia bacterium]